jgi:hypothetical protein
MALTRPTQYSILCTCVKTGWETPSPIRAWSLIRNKKNDCSLWEPLTRWWTWKELSEKMKGRGGGESQGVAGQKKNAYLTLKYVHFWTILCTDWLWLQCRCGHIWRTGWGQRIRVTWWDYFVKRFAPKRSQTRFLSKLTNKLYLGTVEKCTQKCGQLFFLFSKEICPKYVNNRHFVKGSYIPTYVLTEPLAAWLPPHLLLKVWVRVPPQLFVGK